MNCLILAWFKVRAEYNSTLTRGTPKTLPLRPRSDPGIASAWPHGFFMMGCSTVTMVTVVDIRYLNLYIYIYIYRPGTAPVCLSRGLPNSYFVTCDSPCAKHAMDSWDSKNNFPYVHLDMMLNFFWLMAGQIVHQTCDTPLDPALSSKSTFIHDY